MSVCACVWFAILLHGEPHTHTYNRLEYAAIALATHISTSTVEPYLSF